MAELIQKTDTLNQGREKLNEAIKDANMAKWESGQALNTAESTKVQLDTIVIEGDSSVEAAAARVDKDNNVYSTLKERLDAEQSSVENAFGDVDSNISVIHSDIEELRNRKSVVVSEEEPEDADIWFEVVE